MSTVAAEPVGDIDGDSVAAGGVGRVPARACLPIGVAADGDSTGGLLGGGETRAETDTGACLLVVLLFTASCRDRDILDGGGGGGGDVGSGLPE